MTFREAVDKLRAMNIPHSIVQYEYKFDRPTGERIQCGLYTDRYDGIWVWGPTWESAFIQLEERIRVFTNAPASLEGAPTEDMLPPQEPAPKNPADDDIPF